MGDFLRYITNENTNVRKLYKVREPPFLFEFPLFIEGFWAPQLRLERTFNRARAVDFSLHATNMKSSIVELRVSTDLSTLQLQRQYTRTSRANVF